MSSTTSCGYGSVEHNVMCSMRKAELGHFVASLRQSAEKREIVDISARVSTSIGDMMCLMVFGRKYVDEDLGEEGFKAVIEEMLQVGATPNLGDFFLFMAALDLQGLDRRMKKLSQIFYGFLERIIDDHARNKREKKQDQDFVDTIMTILDSGEVGFDSGHFRFVVNELTHKFDPHR